MATDKCSLTACDMGPTIEAIHVALIGSADGRQPGLAEQMRDTKKAFEQHVLGAEGRQKRLSKVEEAINGNGEQGLRSDVRQIKRSFQIVKWTWCIVAAAFLTMLGKDLYAGMLGTAKHGMDVPAAASVAAEAPDLGEPITIITTVREGE